VSEEDTKNKTAAAELKAKLAAVRQAREEREAAEDAADELPRLQLELANEEAIAAAVAKVGPIGKAIGTVNTRHGVIIVKKPNHMLVRKFRDEGDVTTKAWEALVRPCLVHPSAEELDRILEDQPVALVAIGTMVLRLAGLDADGFSGKS
jgi:hypothetical protein